MTPAKTVVLTHEFSPFRGGAATYAEELAGAILALGHAVELWAPYGKRADSTTYSFPVVRLCRGGSLHFLDIAEYTRALDARINALKDANVVPVSVGAHMALMILVRLRHVRCGRMISLLHGSEVLRFRRNPLCRGLARNFFRRQVDQVATVSEFSKSLINKSGILPNETQIVVAPGACSSAARQASNRIERPDDGRLRILTLARVDRRKGQREVARALAGLPKEMREKIQYQVAGRGSARYLREVERVCRAGDVSYVYLGEIARADLAATYRQCDIYAMTSRLRPRSVEGFGITYLEAGFHGKPVVAYASGGAGEAVRANETGLLVPEGDTAALTEALARLIASPELRARLGEGGRRNAARYDWKTTARILLESECSSR